MITYITDNKQRAKDILDTLEEVGLPSFQVTNPQDNDSLVYDSVLEAFINEQTAISNTFKGLNDVIGTSFETGFYEVPNNGYFASSTTNADIDNKNLTQNKQVTNANVVGGQIIFYCGLNPPGGTAAPLIINPIDQVIFINATTFSNIRFNVDLSSTALNPTGFVGQGTMTNAVNITLYIGLSGSTSAPFPFSIQSEKKFICFPEQYLVLSLRLSNQGFPNSPSVDNNTNYYSRIEYLGFKYLPAVAISTTNPTSINFSSIDNYLYYLMNDYNSRTSQTGFHSCYFKSPSTRSIVFYNNKFYDPFSVKQYTMAGYSDIGISFVPDVLTKQTFVESPNWSFIYQYDPVIEAQIIAAMPANAYWPLFCSIKPKPLNLGDDLTAIDDPQNWDMGARMSHFLFGTIYANDFLPSVQSFAMILVDKAGAYWSALYFNGTLNFLPIGVNPSNALQNGFRTFSFNIAGSDFVNTPSPYPWNSNVGRGTFQSNVLRIANNFAISLNEYLYPPILFQGALLINNTGTTLNSIGGCFFEIGVNTNPSLNLPSNVFYPKNSFASNMYPFNGTLSGVRIMLQNGTIPTYTSTTYSNLNVPPSNYFI